MNIFSQLGTLRRPSTIRKRLCEYRILDQYSRRGEFTQLPIDTFAPQNTIFNINFIIKASHHIIFTDIGDISIIFMELISAVFLFQTVFPE